MATDLEIIEQSAKQMSEFRLPRWKELPDLDIYMDQLISLISRYFEKYPGYEEKLLTSSMVNNYVKQKIMPAPVKKKYNRVHIASLIAINLLKSSIPVARVGEIISESIESGENLEAMYDSFCESFESTCASVAESATKTAKRDSSISSAITMAAIRSSAEQSLALDLIKNRQ